MAQGSSPWTGIEGTAAAGELRARRADAAHPHDFFWALDSLGQKILMFQGESLVLDRVLPSLKGVAVELSKERLLLRLLDASAEEIFKTLCCSLIERTRRVSSPQAALVTLLAHLEKWQHFLGRSNGGLLADNEVRGLFGELSFLKEDLLPRFGEASVQFWNGPFGNPQDFTIGTSAFEVKTTSVGAPPVIAISSAEQLWPVGGALHLVHYGIGETAEVGKGAQSLSALVSSIRSFLSDETREAFDDRLLKAGYTDRAEYERRYFAVSPARYFEVRGPFPRLMAEDIPAGVRNVRYGIELAACLPFERQPEWKATGADNGS